MHMNFLLVSTYLLQWRHFLALLYFLDYWIFSCVCWNDGKLDFLSASFLNGERINSLKTTLTERVVATTLSLKELVLKSTFYLFWCPRSIYFARRKTRWWLENTGKFISLIETKRSFAVIEILLIRDSDTFAVLYKYDCNNFFINTPHFLKDLNQETLRVFSSKFRFRMDTEWDGKQTKQKEKTKRKIVFI